MNVEPKVERWRAVRNLGALTSVALQRLVGLLRPRKKTVNAVTRGGAQLAKCLSQIEPKNVRHQDAFARAMIAKAWNEGGLHIANRDDGPPNGPREPRGQEINDNGKS